MKDNLLTSLIELSHHIIREYADENAAAIDATCGNGNDSLFLCKNFRRVYCFDIQKEALQRTDDLLRKNGFSNYELIGVSHAHIGDHVDEKVKAVMFNLGYLPEGDKSITTTADSTISAISEALNLLDSGGVLSIMSYGHKEGLKERTAVNDYVSTLDSRQFHVVSVKMENQADSAPQLVMITRKHQNGGLIK